MKKRFIAFLILFSIIGVWNIAGAASVQGSFTYEIVDGSAIITGYSGIDMEITVPAEIEGHAVTAIGPNAFESLNMSKVNLPNCLTSIGYRAFLGCNKLENISIPESVVSIGNLAFGLCNFESVLIPGNVTFIGDAAFIGCKNLKSITVAPANTVYMQENGVLFDISKKMLHTYLFSNKSDYYKVPEGINEIGPNAFMYTSIKSVTLPNSVEKIGEFAFQNCRLESINFPTGLKTIDNGAFKQCSALKSISFPNSLTSIGPRAFADCTSLRNVILQEGVQTISEMAFSHCPGLMWIKIPMSVSSIGERAFSHKVDFGNPRWWFTIYGSSGSTAQKYARKNGIAFGDAEVYNSRYGEDEIYQSPTSDTVTSSDDPFAIFNNTSNTSINTTDEEKYSYLTELIMNVLWPTKNEKSIKDTSSLSLTQTYCEQALQQSNEITTTVSIQPGEGMNPEMRDILEVLQFRLHQMRYSDQDAYGLDLLTNGSIPISISGLSDEDALYLSSNVLEEDVLAFGRMELDGIIKSALQSMRTESEAINYGDNPVTDLLGILGRKRYGIVDALFGLDGQVEAFNKRMSNKVVMEKNVPQTDFYDQASSSIVFYFTKDDIQEFLDLPQCYFWLRTLIQRWDLIRSYESPVENMVNLSSAGDFYYVIRNNLNYLLPEGNIKIKYDDFGKIVAIEAEIGFSEVSAFFSEVESAKLTFSLYRKTESEDVNYTLSAKLTTIFTAQSASELGVSQYDVMYLDGLWHNTGYTSSEGTLRVRMQEPRHPDYSIDTGLQYKGSQTGTIENGRESQRINFYFKNGGNMQTASLDSAAKINKAGIDRRVNVYISDLQNPLLSIFLVTQAQQNSGLMDNLIQPNGNRLIYPINWSMDMIQTYMLSHIDALLQAVSMLQNVLPPEVGYFLNSIT